MRGRVFIYCLAVLIYAGCKKPGCFEDAGGIVTVSRPPGPFHRIDLFDNVNLVLTQDTTESIKIIAPKNIEPNIITQIANGVLTIRNGTDCKWLRDPSEKPTAFINVKALDYLEYRGSGDVHTANTILANNITFYSATGAGNIDITIDAKQLTASVEYESADFIFHGKADVVYCYAGSRGTLELKDLTVKRLVIGYASVRDVIVNAAEAIEATVYHTGNIYYKGSPTAITTTYYSSGRLYPAP
jgi:hypothetical protein